MNKKILLSLFLVLLVAISVSSVSAEDAVDVISTDDADDVVAVDEGAETLSADPIQPAANTSDAVQSAVNSANKSGDVVDLSKFTEYDFTNNTVTINNDGIIIDGKGTTTIKGWGDGSGIFAIRANNVVIQGINFIDTNPKNVLEYNGNVAGWAIGVSGVTGGFVKDCQFTNFNAGVNLAGTKGFNIEGNTFTGGMSTKLINDPTVNKEEGSKMINVGGTSGLIVKNNTFNGPMLDAISIAQGSSTSMIINNTFIGNAYSIFFGGASTKGSVIANNTFENCGVFNNSGNYWEGLPVISAQKSSDNILVANNTFKATNNNILIAGESANEAHGAPTSIENFNVTGNTVKAYSSDVNMSSVILFRVLARGTPTSFEIKKAINVNDNNLEGDVQGIVVCFASYENVIFSAKNATLNSTLDANGVYGADTLYDTTIDVKDVTLEEGENGTLKFTLKVFSNGLPNKNVTILMDGEVISKVTDEYNKAAKTNAGECSIALTNLPAGVKYVTIMFMGEGNIYKSSFATAKITVNAKPTPATPATPAAPATQIAKKTTLTAKKVTLKAKKAKKIKVTLKAEGKAVAGKTVTIKVAKKTFKAKTNAKGIATIKVKVAKKGSYKATVKFAGDKAYKAATKKVKFTVKK